jgi:hypothetical protein
VVNYKELQTSVYRHLRREKFKWFDFEGTNFDPSSFERADFGAALFELDRVVIILRLSKKLAVNMKSSKHFGASGWKKKCWSLWRHEVNLGKNRRENAQSL